MRANQKVSFPFGLLALECLGTLVMGLGLAKQFGGLDLFPVINQFDQSGWLMIGLGFLLTLPFLFYLVTRVINQTMPR